MQSASSLNHTDEGNSLCNEIFFRAFSFFLSFDELQNWQRGVRQVRVTHSLFVQKDSGKKNNHILDIFNSIKLNFQLTSSLPRCAA